MIDTFAYNCQLKKASPRSFLSLAKKQDGAFLRLYVNNYMRKLCKLYLA